MKKTKHAIERQQQRAISDHVIEIVLANGVQDNKEGFTMTKKVFAEVLANYKSLINDAHRKLNVSKDAAERENLSQTISRLKVERRRAEKSLNVRAVVDDGYLITVVKLSGRGQKRIGQKLKNERVH